MMNVQQILPTLTNPSANDEGIFKPTDKPKVEDVANFFKLVHEKCSDPADEASERKKYYKAVYKITKSCDVFIHYLSTIDKIKCYVIKTELFDFLISKLRKNLDPTTFTTEKNFEDIPNAIDLISLLLCWDSPEHYEDSQGPFEIFLNDYCQRLVTTKDIADGIYKLLSFIKCLDECMQAEDSDLSVEDRKLNQQVRDLGVNSIRIISRSLVMLKDYPQDKRLLNAISLIFDIDTKYLCQNLSKDAFEAIQINCSKIEEIYQDNSDIKSISLNPIFINALKTHNLKLCNWVLTKLQVLGPKGHFILYQTYLNSVKMEEVNIVFIEKYLEYLNKAKLFSQLIEDVKKCLNKDIISEMIIEQLKDGLWRLGRQKEISSIDCLGQKDAKMLPYTKAILNILKGS